MFIDLCSHSFAYVCMHVCYWFCVILCFPLLKRGGNVMFCGYLCFLVSLPVVVFLYQYIVHEHVLKYQSMPWYFYC